MPTSGSNATFEERKEFQARPHPFNRCQPRQHQEGRNQILYDRDVQNGGVDNHEFERKVDLLTFSGKLDVEAFLDWIKNVGNFFEYMETPKNKKVKLVTL